MKINITNCHGWTSLAVAKCSQCENRSTQIVSVPNGLIQKKSFPLCVKHFNEWIDGTLELTLKEEKQAKEI
jgi:hypothetical protein